MAKPRKQLDIVTRRYDINWRDAQGDIHAKPIVAPAMPVFEKAFGAFAQGTLIQTQNGYCAIEDLHPGDRIATVDGGLQPIRWIGAMTVYPTHLELGVPSSRLYRITDGSFGHDRSAPDLMVGPAARILPGTDAINSSSPLLTPNDLADGQSVIAINPMSQVRTFHLALASHHLMRANGVLVESYHPGAEPGATLGPELFDHFQALFPHVQNLSDFGPLNHQRQA
jgi:hypothetical protein